MRTVASQQIPVEAIFSNCKPHRLLRGEEDGELAAAPETLQLLRARVETYIADENAELAAKLDSMVTVRAGMVGHRIPVKQQLASSWVTAKLKLKSVSGCQLLVAACVRQLVGAHPRHD